MDNKIALEKLKLMRKRRKFFDTFIDVLDEDELVEIIDFIIDNNLPTQLIGMNAQKIELMEKEPLFKDIINNSNLIHADGISIVWAAHKLGIPLSGRVAGIDLFLKLIENAPKKNHKIFLLGAKQHVVEKVNKIFKQKYPGIKIVGFRNGYFDDSDDEDIVNEIRESDADMLFVAISSPKKEYWIDKYLKEFNVPFVMGVGGSFDVVAGEVNRAPIWMQRCGLEWLFRFIQEPKRMWKRNLFGNTGFVIYTYRYVYKHRINRHE